MTTIRVPVQSRDALIDVLADQLTGWPGLQVRATVPDGWQPHNGPLLIVEHDGTSGGHWPVATVDTIRLTSWTLHPDPALLLVALGAALGCPIPGVARARPGLWPLSATDTTTSAHLESATVLLTARTEEKDI